MAFPQPVDPLEILLGEAQQIRAEEQARIQAAKAGLERRFWQFIRLIQNSVTLSSPAPKAIDQRAAQLGIYVGKDGRLRMNVQTPYVGVDGRVSLGQEASQRFWETLWSAIKGVLERDIPAQEQAELIERLVDTALKYGVEIRFELLEVPGYGPYVAAKVRVPGLGYAEGWARIPTPVPNGRSAEDTNPVEVAQTSAAGRALGFLALGLLGNGIASAEEVEQALAAREGDAAAAPVSPAAAGSMPAAAPDGQVSNGATAAARASRASAPASPATPPAEQAAATNGTPANGQANGRSQAPQAAADAATNGAAVPSPGQAVQLEGVVSTAPRQLKHNGAPYMACQLMLQDGRGLYLVGFQEHAWKLVENLVRGQIVRVRGRAVGSSAVEPDELEILQAAAS